MKNLTRRIAEAMSAALMLHCMGSPEELLSLPLRRRERRPFVFTPDFRNELFPTNPRALCFISIYAGLTAIKRKQEGKAKCRGKSSYHAAIF